MRSFIRFWVFVGIVFLAILLNITSAHGLFYFAFFWLLSTALLMVLSQNFPWAQRVIWATVGHVGENNNYPTYILVVLIVVCTIVGFKVGPGDPFLKISLRELSSEISQEKMDAVSKTWNRINWGKDQTSKEADLEKKALELFKRDNRNNKFLFEYRDRGPREALSNYEERCSNLFQHRLFLTNAEIDTEVVRYSSQVDQTEKPDPIKTWFWFRMAASFFLMLPFFLVYSFRDEVARFCISFSDKIETMNRDYHDGLAAQTAQNQPTQQAQPAGQTPATGTQPVTPSAQTTPLVTTKSGFWNSANNWFLKLYTSDMAAEFSIRLLQGFARRLTSE
jgi:hypothetical protein